MNKQQAYIYNFLSKQGLTPAGIAGVMGNLQHESGMNPGNLNDTWNNKYDLTDEEFTKKVNEGEIDIKEKSGAYGIAQWLGDRKKALADFAKNSGTTIDDLNTQCNFLMQELEAKPGLLNYLRTTNDPVHASSRFQGEFEVCEDGTKERRENAEGFFAQISNGEIPVGDVAVLGTMRAANGKEFDPQFYAQQYPDVAAEVGNSGAALLKHYNEFGAKEGRKANIEDFPIKEVEPFESKTGTAEFLEKPSIGFSTSKPLIADNNKSFDPAFYAQQNPDVVSVYGNKPEDLLKHYNEYGAKEGRMANAEDIVFKPQQSVPETDITFIGINGKNFDPQFYANQYPDVTIALGTDPQTLLNHYNEFGAKEGRLANMNDVPEVNQSGLEQVANNFGFDGEMDFELQDGSILSIETENGKSEFFLDGESLGQNAREVEKMLSEKGLIGVENTHQLDDLIRENSVQLQENGLNVEQFINSLNNQQR